MVRRKGDIMNKTIMIRNQKMNVGVKGDGDTSVVIVAGSGVAIPTLEYAMLSDALSKYFTVIIPEKLGYGLSDITDENRNADTAVEDYRLALKELGISSPVYLAAHSMGFIEALRWAQMYPNEILGLVGLDAATPEHYKNFNIEQGVESIKMLSENDQIRQSFIETTLQQYTEELSLTPEEKETYLSILQKIAANKVWVNEAQNLKDSIDLADNSGVMQVPTLFFLSNGEGTGMTSEVWQGVAKQYLEKVSNAEQKSYDYAHHLFYKDPTVLSDLAENFNVFADKHVK